MTFFAGKPLTAAELNEYLGDSGWVTPTLGANWSFYSDATYGAVRYRKIGKLVSVRGLLAASSIAAAAFTLPTGFRPSLNLIFPAVANSWTTGAASAGTAHTHSQAGAGGADLRVSPAGAVTITGIVVPVTWVSFSAITFLVD